MNTFSIPKADPCVSSRSSPTLTTSYSSLRLSTTTSFYNFTTHQTQSQAGLRFDPIIHFDALILIDTRSRQYPIIPWSRNSHWLARPSQSHTPSHPHTHSHYYGRLARTYLHHPIRLYLLIPAMSLTSSSMSRSNPTTMAVAQPKPKSAPKASTQQNKLKAQMHRRSRTGLSAMFTRQLVTFSLQECPSCRL
jgi:hypothetical protein